MDDPVHLDTGYTPPRERDPGCVDRTFGEMRSGPAVLVAVGRDGRTKQLAPLSLYEFLADRVKAVQDACTFEPESDASGKPVSLWVVLPRTRRAVERRRSR